MYENERKDRINAPKCRLSHLTPYLQCLSFTWETRLVSGTTRTLTSHTISKVRDVRFNLYVRRNGRSSMSMRLRIRMRIRMILGMDMSLRVRGSRGEGKGGEGRRRIFDLLRFLLRSNLP